MSACLHVCMHACMHAKALPQDTYTCMLRDSKEFMRRVLWKWTDKPQAKASSPFQFSERLRVRGSSIFRILSLRAFRADV